MISALLRYWNSLEVSQVRRRRLPGRLMPHVPAGASVLDVGSGDGHIARRLLLESGAASIQGVDVLLHPAPAIPTVSFDGERLPHPDDAFDLVTLVDVLHHTDHPERLLREALRVSRGRVLIKDHYWVSRLDRWVLHVADYLGNKPYGVSLPYNFLRLEEWATLFERLAVRVISSERFIYAPYDRSRQVIFVVEPCAAAEPAPSGMIS